MRWWSASLAGRIPTTTGGCTVMLAPWVIAESCSTWGPGRSSRRREVWSAVVRLTVRREPAFPVSPHFAQVVARSVLPSAQDDSQRTAKHAHRGTDRGVRRRSRCSARNTATRHDSTGLRRLSIELRSIPDTQTGAPPCQPTVASCSSSICTKTVLVVGRRACAGCDAGCRNRVPPRRGIRASSNLWVKRSRPPCRSRTNC